MYRFWKGGFESGLFTPVVAATTQGNLVVTYVRQFGYWSRIGGSKVFLAIDLQFTPTFTTAAGPIRIVGSPTGAPLQGMIFLGPVYLRGNGAVTPTFPTGTTQLVTRLVGSGTLQFAGNGSAAPNGQNNLQMSNFISGTSYFINASVDYIEA